MAARVRPQTKPGKVKEDFSHRDHASNPRKWPVGAMEYDSPSKRKIWRDLDKFALLSGPEMRLLQHIPGILGTGDYANLGHALGASAILLADGLREYGYEGHVYSCDLFPKKNDYKKAVRLAQKFDVINHLYICKGSTREYADGWADKKFRAIFIDADHSYEGVKNDLYNYMFLVDKGGFIMLHDTNQDFSHQAIQDVLVGKWPELEQFHVHRIRTFMKPK